MESIKRSEVSKKYLESLVDSEFCCRQEAELISRWNAVRRANYEMQKMVSDLRADATKNSQLGYKAERAAIQAGAAGITLLASTLCGAVETVFDVVGVVAKKAVEVGHETANSWQQAGWRYDIRNSKEFQAAVAGLPVEDSLAVAAWLARYTGASNPAAAPAAAPAVVAPAAAPAAAPVRRRRRAVAVPAVPVPAVPAKA